MRSARKKNAVASEQDGGLNASPASEEVIAAEGEAGKARKPKSAKNVKQECKKKIIAEMDQIVTGLIEKAKRGSYNEAKLLLTIADTDDGKGAEEKAAQAAADASLAELLLGQLGASESATPVKTRSSRRKGVGRPSKKGVASRSRRRLKQPSAETAELPQQPDQVAPEMPKSEEPADPVPTEV
jgi:hypothetical protein